MTQHMKIVGIDPDPSNVFLAFERWDHISNHWKSCEWDDLRRGDIYRAAICRNMAGLDDMTPTVGQIGRSAEVRAMRRGSIEPEEFYATLSPKIQRLVRHLHGWGYETTDSGDGTNYRDGMECAVPYPMVVIHVDDGKNLELVADDIWRDLEILGIPMGQESQTGVRNVEASYSPIDGKLVLVTHITDDDLP